MQSDLSTNPLFEKVISEYLQNGYCIVDDWLTHEQTSILKKEILGIYNDDLFKKAAIGNKFEENIAKQIRGDFIYWLDEPSMAKAFFKKTNDFIEYINKTCFAGIVSKEFHYAVYPTGTFYKKHIDTFQKDDKRSISIVFYLNDEWHKSYGGELALYLKDKTLKIYPTIGKIVIFDSKTIPHEVLPVLQNQRYSITGWLKTS